MPRTTFSQKMGLLLLGLFLSMFFLEIGLWLAEKIYFVAQDYQNRQTKQVIKKNEGRAYKILCLGESTTAFGGEDSYPRQLEKVLNQNSSQKFVVINKGVPATTTDQIVSKLERYFDEYRPDMVTAMMGVNDTQTTPVYEGSRRLGFQLKVVKLFRMIVEHVQYRRQEMLQDRARDKMIKDASSGDYRAYLKLAEYYESVEDFAKAEEQYTKILHLSSVPSIFKLGVISALAQCYSQEKKYSQAESIYQNLLKNFSGRGDEKILFYDLLVELYLDEEKFSDAIDVFEQRTAIKPTGLAMYMKISYAYRKLKRFEELEQVLRRGLAIHSVQTEHYVFLYSELGYCLLENKKYQQAQEVFRKIQNMDLKQSGEIRVDIDYGLERAAKGMKSEVINLNWQSDFAHMAYYLPATVVNYRHLKDAVVRRGIKFIAIQYPMRSLRPLKELLGSDQHILFVDNENVFKKAVAESEYAQYFVDHFGGDFGHCTFRGNALLAHQVAEVIEESIK